MNDTAVIGALVHDNRRTDAPGGVVRAFDVRTGKLRWAWDTVSEDYKKRHTTTDGRVEYSQGSPNVWAPISGDVERGIVFVPTVFAEIIFPASESGRTTIEKPDENNHDSSKLSVRSDAKSAKSWVKFDLGNLDVTSLEAATLTVTLHQEKSGNRHFDVSYVNDNFRGNIDWDERTLTWDNAPGNDTASLVSLNAGKTTLLGTVDFTDGAPGDAFTIDVLESLESDTDGIVQFVLYNSNGSTNFSTHDHGEEAWRPFITVIEGAKAKAKKPLPAEGTTDVSLTPVLSWQPGAYVDGLSPMHKIFFSTDFNDVNNGIGGVTQDASDYAHDSLLEFGKIYYWRVDEANDVSAWDIGDVWEFRT